MNPKLLSATVCLFLLALPLNVFAQPPKMGLMALIAVPGGGQRDAWIVSKIDDNGSFVWGAGFSEILGLTPEQTNELQDVIARPDSDPNDYKVGYLDTSNSWTKLNQVLTPEQLSQFAEISFQASGGLVANYLNHQLLDVVNLTDAQKEQIRKLEEERKKEYIAARDRVPEKPPFDHKNATREESDKYMDDYMAAVQAMQRAAREKEMPEIFKKYTEQMKAVLTPEQRAKAEKLTAEAPALVEKFMGKKQDASGQGGRTPYIYVPGTGAWQPGDPLPAGVVPPEQPASGRFPRSENP